MPLSDIPDSKQFVDDVVRISIEAGQKILQIYDTDYSVEMKDDFSPVTEADRAADKIIRTGLQQLNPSLPILSEESNIVHYTERSKWDRYWLVDPMDGTNSFLKHSDQFTVNIALIQNNASVMGVVHCPVKKRTYWGVAGSGALCMNDVKGEIRPVRVREFNGGNATIIVSSRIMGSQQLNRFRRKLERDSIDSEVKFASSSLKFCCIAEGKFDVFPGFGATSEWDTAAAQCVVECAGGTVRDFQGNVVRYNKPNLDNPAFVAAGGGDFPWLDYF